MLSKLKICECGTGFSQHNSLDKYCSFSCKLKFGKPPNLKLKPLININKVSKKRKIDNLKYLAQRIIFLGKPQNKICPITGAETTDIHHKKGRVGDLFLDQNYWIALSRLGHKYVEENPDWAKKNGYSLHRLSK